MFAHSFLVYNNSLLREAVDQGPEGSWLATGALWLYLSVLVLLAVYGAHRFLVVGRFLASARKQPKPARRFAEEELPGVTVQLPLFNELYVVEQLLESVSRIDYPRDRFQIQVLDDSTDETVDIARRVVERLAATGLDIEYVHRTDRTGFKAGALDNGMKSAKHDLIAIFDADFRPEADFLHQIIHYFSDEKVGVAQSRWGHLNEDQSLLTKTQALMLNGHFLVEHPARNRTGLYFNFNGTGGLWRRQAIEDAGGWEHDTLTEDLDLSYRAQMKGWKFIYDPSIVSPAELPAEMNAFKSQQHRWAKGSVQVMLKLLKTVLKNPVVPLRQKVEAVFHLTGNLAYVLMIPMILLTPVMFVMRNQFGAEASGNFLWADILIMTLASGSMVAFYGAAQLVSHEQGWKRLYLVPALMCLGLGLAVNQARAVFEALIGQESPFVRTPKFNIDGTAKSQGAWKSKKYRGVQNWVPIAEVILAVYYGLTLCWAIYTKTWGALPFLMLFAGGFTYVSALSLGQRRAKKAAAPAAETAAPASA